MPKRKARHNLQLRRRPSFISSKAKPLAMALALAVNHDLNAADVAEQYIDWIPRSQLTAEEQAQLAPFCQGTFREPEGTHDEMGLDPKLAPIRIESGRTSVTNGSKILLEGEVDIIQGARSLHADRISYDRDTADASLVGNVTIRQPGTLIQGEEAHLLMDSNQARFVEAKFLLHSQHLRGGAESIEQTENKVIILTNGRVTTCEPVEESWVLEGGKLIIDPVKGQGSGRNLVLRFGGVPILYLPYIRFPLGDHRQSGFLFPVVGYNQSNGADLAVPYYFNLAPNYDLLLTPRYITERGAMLEAQGRHLSRLFETDVNLAMLANDRGGDDPDYQEIIDSGAASEEQLLPYVGENRWLAHIEQAGGRDQRWHSRIDYSAVSDLDYFRDLDTASFSVANSTYLNQSAELGYTLPNWMLKARLQDYQTLLRDLDETYRQLPRVDIDGRYHWGDLYLQLDNEYVNFDHSQAFRSDGSSIITGQRARSDYQLTWDKQWQWGYLKPQLGMQHLRYQLDENGLGANDPSSINLTASQAAVDLGLIFDRSDLDTGRLQQTLEPRLYYLYREYADHSELFGLTAAEQAVNFDTTALNFTYSQLFRDTRFSGGDRIDDANQLALGLTSRWYGGANNRELVTASLGQIYHFADRRVTLQGEPETFSRSEIATQLNASLTENLDLRADFLVNDKNANVSRGSIFGHYADERRLFNLGYRFISSHAVGATSAEDVKQLDFSFSTSMNSQWQAVGRVNYDITDRRELEAFAGFEYNDCCYRLRVLARRWLDSKIADLITDNDLQYDQGIFFEIQLKGLGGTGDRVRTLLEDSIVGWREQQFNSYH
jgi:LPS-assembly protein